LPFFLPSDRGGIRLDRTGELFPKGIERLVLAITRLDASLGRIGILYQLIDEKHRIRRRSLESCPGIRLILRFVDELLRQFDALLGGQGLLIRTNHLAQKITLLFRVTFDSGIGAGRAAQHGFSRRQFSPGRFKFLAHIVRAIRRRLDLANAFRDTRHGHRSRHPGWRDKRECQHGTKHANHCARTEHCRASSISFNGNRVHPHTVPSWQQLPAPVSL